MKVAVKILMVFVLIFLGSCKDSIQSKDFFIVNSVDSLATTYVKPNGPGFTVLVMENGKEIIRQGYGLASLELSVRTTPQLIYKIGSLSKQFTAAAILKLEEDGKLSIKDNIQKYLPEYPNKGYNITIENLLNHTSGIPSFTERSDISDIEKTALTPEQIVALFKDEPLNFPPGSKYSYSDSGYTLLGLIIEKTSGLGYESFLVQNIFKPAKLKNTFCDNPEALIPNRTQGYSLDSLGFKPAQFMTMKVPFAAGNIISNVNDLYAWSKSLHSGDIISKSQLSKMFTSAQLTSGTSTGYGLGSFVKTFANETVYFHDGWIYGFVSSQFYFPESDTFIFVLSNSTSIDAHEIASKIVAIVYNRQPSEAVEQLMWY
ncbi:beta-lactamase family protein [Flavobacteriaceae bacterium GSB9]|nr:beta-lactamase family protein [Flavobacteriaceae bacterium GSB9]